MKSLGTLILAVTIFGSSLAFADHQIQKKCVQILERNDSGYISVEVVINEETGLTKALLASTTFDDVNGCLDSLDKKFEAPEMPTNSHARLRSRSACYTTVEETRVIYLLNEKVNPETGLVVALEIKNEFDSPESCFANIEK